jgi:hypothetical protein
MSHSGGGHVLPVLPEKRSFEVSPALLDALINAAPGTIVDYAFASTKHRSQFLHVAQSTETQMRV